MIRITITIITTIIINIIINIINSNSIKQNYEKIMAK